jgi:hypothetical protein
MYYDSGTNSLYYWNGTSWVTGGGGATNPNATYAARAYRANAGAAVGVNAWTKIPLDTTSFDPGNNFQIANSRYICPVAGYYAVDGRFTLNVGGADYNIICSAAIYVNGLARAEGTRSSHSDLSTFVAAAVTDVVQCNAGDYIELYGIATQGYDIIQGATADYLSVSIVSPTSVQQQPLQPASQARAYRNAALTTTSGAWTKIPVDTVAFDASGGAMQAANGRYVCPTAGYYQVNFELAASAPASTDVTFQAAVYRNGSLTGIGGADPRVAPNGTVAVSGGDVIQCNAGDYLELWSFASGAWALSVGTYANYLSVSLIGTAPVAAPSYAARMALTTNQAALVASTWTKVLLDSAQTDPSGCFNRANNRYVCPVAGIYDVLGSLQQQESGTGTYTLVAAGIYKNGALYSYTAGLPAVQTAAAATIADKIQCNAGDYLELWVQNGQATTVLANVQTTFLAVSLLTQAPAPLPVTVPPVITTGGLPSSPVDGQECYYVVDATNGVVWHLKYRAGSASAHKWELVGGSPLLVLTTAVATAAAANTTYNLSTSLVTIPLAGDYLVSAAGQGTGSTAGASTVTTTLYAGAGTPSNTFAQASVVTVAGTSYAFNWEVIRRVVANLTAGTQLGVSGSCNNVGATWGPLQQEVLPVRVG